jgi:hypothetical protein
MKNNLKKNLKKKRNEINETIFLKKRNETKFCSESKPKRKIFFQKGNETKTFFNPWFKWKYTKFSTLNLKVKMCLAFDRQD